MNSNAILAIIAVAAVASPVIVTIINNCFFLKKIDEAEKRKEAKQEKYNKEGLYVDFIKYSTLAVQTYKEQGYDEYCKLYPLILIQAPEEVIDAAMEFNIELYKSHYDEAGTKLNILVFTIGRVVFNHK